jgi:hypothetical protein
VRGRKLVEGGRHRRRDAVLAKFLRAMDELADA